MKDGKVRLQKFLSNVGIASRRRAEVLIEAGKVKINGRTAKLGDKVDPNLDEVIYDGKKLEPVTELYYLAVNKPTGYISSRFDPQERRSVYGFLPKDLQNKLWSVGRLDFHTEGLILFTNDGDLTQKLAHPKFEHDKEYEITTNRPVAFEDIGKLKKGVSIGDGDFAAADKIVEKDGKLYMTLHEGKKRQIRRMIEAVGYKVANLKRIRLNKLHLKGIPLGKYKIVQKSDII